MSKEILQNAMQQILHSYQRCGLKWFERGPLTGVAPDILETLANLNSDQEAFSKELRSVGPALNHHQAAAGSHPNDSFQASSEGRDVLPNAKKLSEEMTDPNAAARAPRQPTPIDTETGSGGRSVVLSPEAGHADPWPETNRDDSGRRDVLGAIAERVNSCRLCSELCDYRQKTVFGAGPLRPTVCFMGEAPGADEDRTGMPFVGAAGQLLTRIIEATQLRREDVYILNALKCRPPNNRTPTESEIANCRTYLMAQLDVLQPKYIVCLGAVAVRSLLNSTSSIGRLRGKVYQFRGARVIITYHPSYLLRQQQAKRLVWEDMQMLMRELEISVAK